VADMTPQTDTPHCSTQPVRYALEMNQGWFAERRIGVQSVIEGLPGLRPTSNFPKTSYNQQFRVTK